MTIFSSQNRPVSGDQIAALFRRLGWASGNHPEALNTVAVQSKILAAWEGEQLVGFISALSDGMNGYIPYLCVDPEFQHQGIGRLLLEQMVAELEGHLRITLTAYPEAQGFYEKIGFWVRTGKVSMAFRDL